MPGVKITGLPKPRELYTLQTGQWFQHDSHIYAKTQQNSPEQDTHSNPKIYVVCIDQGYLESMDRATEVYPVDVEVIVNGYEELS